MLKRGWLGRAIFSPGPNEDSHLLQQEMNRTPAQSQGPKTQESAPPCAILDDAELANPATSFRGWRETAESLRAGHLFGSAQRSFPSAFQSFRSDKKKGGAAAGPSPFPFRTSKGGGKKDLSGNTVAVAPPVAAARPPALTIRSVEEEIRYSQCTPPAQEDPPVGYSPKTPPWWDASGNLMGGSV